MVGKMPVGNLRIGIDARTLGASRITGVERYLRNLVAHLSTLPYLPDTLLYVDSQELALAPPIAMGHSMCMRVVPPGRAWLRWRLPRALRADRVSVMHFPATVLPPFLPCPSVVTVYDLAFEFFPESYDPADLRMQLRGARKGIRRARSILAISQATADDIVRLYHRDPADITVTPLGAEERFLNVKSQPPPPGWPDSYILYVGRLTPRKNIESLLEAYAMARARGVSDPLMVVGGGVPDYVSSLRMKALGFNVIEDVVFAGYLPDALLPAVYANARALACLSLYEGFGLPVIEAMACGVPVVASSTSSFPEIVGDAGILVDPQDVSAQAEALVDICTDDARSRELSTKARERARLFSWNEVARSTLNAYVAAAAR
jgi:glycosyltransferase involved in cell wall biosynthesis